MMTCVCIAILCLGFCLGYLYDHCKMARQLDAARRDARHWSNLWAEVRQQQWHKTDSTIKNQRAEIHKLHRSNARLKTRIKKSAARYEGLVRGLQLSGFPALET